MQKIGIVDIAKTLPRRKQKNTFENISFSFAVFAEDQNDVLVAERLAKSFVAAEVFKLKFRYFHNRLGHRFSKKIIQCPTNQTNT